MKHFLLFTLCLLFTASVFSQVDYRISGARKVKATYNPFPHDMSSEALDWTGVSSRCLKHVKYGKWFELKVKGDKVKFSVHTGGKMGTASDPGIYLGKVVETSKSRSLEEVECVLHSGNEGEYSLEATGLSKEEQYYVLVTTLAQDETFALSITEDFDPAPVQKESVAEATGFQSIFGRILDRDGMAKAGVKVSLRNKENESMQMSTTDEKGVFKFEKLPASEAYMTYIEEDDTDLKVEMFLLDENGAIKSRSSRIGDQLYAFGVDSQLMPFVKLLTTGEYAIDVKLGRVGIVGKVVDRKTFLFGQAGVQVGLYDDQRLLLASSETDKNGLFTFEDIEDREYEVKVEADPKKEFTEIIIVDDLNVPIAASNSEDMDGDGYFSFEKLPQEIVRMKRMEVSDTEIIIATDFSGMEDRQPIVLRNILFASGSADLLETSFSELDQLVGELIRLESVRLEVSGHTDNVGSAEANQILSENRAKSVVDYLVFKGIDRGRLIHIGYGQTKPVASNQTDDGKRQNRRVEVKVLD